MKRILCLMGPPGAGKGTFSSQFLTENRSLSINYLSVGHELRKILSDNTGNLAKIELVESLITDFLGSGEKFILDGYPRNLEQLERLINRSSTMLFINLELTDKDKLYNRLFNRYTCHLCGRSYPCINICDSCKIEIQIRLDDANLDAIMRRMDIYAQEIIRIQDCCQKHQLEFFKFDVSNEGWINQINNLLLNFFRD